MLLKFAKQLLSGLWRTVFGEPKLRVKDVRELPDRLNAGIVYLVGEDEYLWFAAMICPCGCGSTLHMNLMPHSRPRWKVIKHDDGSVTLAPSISRLTGCHSHFFLRRSRIVWWYSPSANSVRRKS